MKLDKQTVGIIAAILAALGMGGEQRMAIDRLGSDVTDIRERVARIEATLEADRRVVAIEP